MCLIPQKLRRIVRTYSFCTPLPPLLLLQAATAALRRAARHKSLLPFKTRLTRLGNGHNRNVVQMLNGCVDGGSRPSRSLMRGSPPLLGAYRLLAKEY